MTQEQKKRIEKLADQRGLVRSSAVFGAQNILDNYHDYGLQSMEKYKDMVSSNVRLGAENQRLREALDSILKKYDDNRIVLDAGLETALEIEMYLLAKEALKQHNYETESS